jgi:trans-aconitate 2-methyltransferase
LGYARKGAFGFLTAYAEALRPHYPPQPDGSVLMPFRRLFVLAKN